MDIDNSVAKAWGWGAGAEWERSMGEKGDIFNTLKNKEFKFKNKKIVYS